MPFKLPDLPYPYAALEPHIDAKTMGIHHDKHHQAYVNNLNAALEGHDDLQERGALELIVDLDALPEDIRGAVRNNGGGHVNHSMFWTVLTPNGGGTPGGVLGAAIDKAFGSFDEFKAQFQQAGMTQFGSGWAWLCVDPDGELVIAKTANQDNPVSQGLVPIFGVDVWEHAYYLNYQNRRADYLEAVWNVVDWKRVGSYHGLTKVVGGLGQLGDWAQAQWSKLEEAFDKLTD